MFGSSAQNPCPICSAPTSPGDAFPGTGLRYCAACEFISLAGLDEQDLYGDDYFQAYVGGDYVAREAQRRHESRLRLDALEASVPAPAKVLEIGAAAGFFLDEARGRGYEGVGLEPNDTMAKHARERLGLDVRTGRLGASALPEDHFDAVCAFHVVEHLPDPLDSMELIRRVLRPGGCLLIEVPNARSAGARRQGADWKPLDLPHHLGHHGPTSMGKLMERAGLEPVSTDTVPFAYYSRAPTPVRLLQGALEGLRSGAPRSIKPHPDAHQLLRASARRPPA